MHLHWSAHAHEPKCPSGLWNTTPQMGTCAGQKIGAPGSSQSGLRLQHLCHCDGGPRMLSVLACTLVLRKKDWHGLPLRPQQKEMAYCVQHRNQRPILSAMKGQPLQPQQKVKSQCREQCFAHLRKCELDNLGSSSHMRSAHLLRCRSGVSHTHYLLNPQLE